MDSNCHSEWSECDKKEGDRLWIISCGLAERGYVIPIEYTINSPQPQLLKLRLKSCDPSFDTSRFKTDVPLYIYPRYEKNGYMQTFDKHSIKTVKTPRHTNFRVPLEIKLRIGTSGTLQGSVKEQTIFISVAIPVLKADGEINEVKDDQEIDAEDMGEI